MFKYIKRLFKRKIEITINVIVPEKKTIETTVDENNYIYNWKTSGINYYLYTSPSQKSKKRKKGKNKNVKK